MRVSFDKLEAAFNDNGLLGLTASWAGLGRPGPVLFQVSLRKGQPLTPDRPAGNEKDYIMLLSQTRFGTHAASVVALLEPERADQRLTEDSSEC